MRDTEWIDLSASERACYSWPEDTELHRQCRAAYVAGAAFYARLDRIEALEAALHEAFMATCSHRDNPDVEVFREMSKEDARIIACGLLHDGLDADSLSDKARQEIKAAIVRLLDLARAALEEHPNGLQNLRAIMADQPYRNSALSIHEIEAVLDNEGGFMPDESVVWFREARGKLGVAALDKEAGK